MAKSIGRPARRRSPGEGTIYPRKDRPGWRGRVTWTDPDGRRHSRVVAGATSQEARAKLDELRRQLRLGGLDAPDAGTVGAYLEAWIERHRDRVRPSTWRTAEQYVRGYLVPSLGRFPLGRLTAADVERALGAYVRDGRPGTTASGAKRPVSAVTASHVRSVLRRALGDAERAGLVARNVAADATPPRIPHRPVTYLSADELRRFLSVTRNEPLGPLWALAASTGLRRGELVGLRWSDVDLVAGTLRVSRAVSRDARGGWSAAETKSARSRRTLPLSSTARHAIESQRRRQAAAKLAAGSAWQDREGLVFTDAAGRPLLPEYVSHAFDRDRRRSGLRSATLHQLRHTAATLMLAEGIPLPLLPMHRSPGVL